MKQKLITGTLILTVSSLMCRLIGFFYRLFLSHTIGAEGMGIVQLVLPVYSLALALSASGIQTALSRLIAAAFANQKQEKAGIVFLSGTIMAFSFSLILSILIRTNASFLAEVYLKEPRCKQLLQILSYALPFSALHTCINGWFFGSQRIKIPALILTIEELIRLGATYVIYYLFQKHNIEISSMIAILGFLISECSSVLLSFLFLCCKGRIFIRIFSFAQCKACGTEILKTGVPLTMNRLLLNVMHSVEAVLIPFSLQKGAFDASNSLKALGTVTGMALPLVLFPTAIINAMSAILLPAISEKQASKNQPAIFHLVKKTTWYSFLIGIAFTVFFFLFGKSLGESLYHNTQAGYYIQSLALICPFLFINITLASVMNGLGKTHLCFWVNFIDMTIRVLAICFFVPSMQISGYIYGVVGGECICTILSLWIISHIIQFHPQNKSAI